MSLTSLSSLKRLLPLDGEDSDGDEWDLRADTLLASSRRTRWSWCFSALRRKCRLFMFFFLLSAILVGALTLKRDLNLLDTLRHKVLDRQPAASRYSKPPDSRVVGIVFYGRRHRVSILDCYLKDNLVSAGGWLDEVIWVVNTQIPEDLQYLDELLLTSEGYRKIEVKDQKGHGYVESWKAALEPENIYLKLDDDVVYLDREAVPLMVQLKIDRPDALLVSANMINSPEFNWLHYRAGAIHPYLPEITPAEDQLSTSQHAVWRASELPNWFGPNDLKSPGVGNKEFNAIWANRHRHETQKGGDEWEDENEEEDVVVPRHRWLPLSHLSDISRTPIAQAAYDPSGPGWYSWAIPAQQHYSFLQNLEDERTNVYFLTHGKGPSSDATWDTTGHRISINCMVIQGRDILDNMDGMGEDDEQYLSVDLPLKLNRRVLVHTQAVASHYRFQAQAGIDNTDVFARYHAYALEKVCPGCMVRPTGTVPILGDV